MAIHIYTSADRARVQAHCYQHYIDILKREPQGDPLLYLVPEQMSFQLEYALARDLGGLIRGQVLGFTRLAYRVLQEVGGWTRVSLDHVGRTMLLRHIVDEHKDKLKLFHRSVDKLGFYTELEQLFTLYRGQNISSTDLQLFIEGLISPEDEEQSVGQSFFAQKLHDFQLLLHAYEQKLVTHYTDQEDQLRLLAEQLHESMWLAQATLFIDGFYHFSAQELEVLEALSHNQRELHIALVLPSQSKLKNEHARELFGMTAETLSALKDIAEKTKQKVNLVDLDELQPVTDLDQEKQGSSVHQLELLRRHYTAYTPVTSQNNDETAVQLFEASNRQAEVDFVARKILHEVQDQGMRWQDYAILIRDVQGYHDLLEQVFDQYHIPLFLDVKRKMIHHPIVECLRSLLDIFKSQWKYDAVLRCLKTDLLTPWKNRAERHEWQHKIDVLENMALAYGLQGHKWFSFNYKKLAEDAGRLGMTETLWLELQADVLEPIKRLEAELNEAEDVGSFCLSLFQFIEQIDAPYKLQQWAEEAEQDQLLQKAREHEQAWQSIGELLDQMVEILGDHTLSLDSFIQLLEAGLESLQFSLIPPALDQVVVGCLEKSRILTKKRVFILGLNEGVLPKQPELHTLIRPEEYDQLAKGGVQLGMSELEQLAAEEFYFYLGLQLPQERLYLTYALSDEDGKALETSLYLQRLSYILPQVQLETIPFEPLQVGPSDYMSFITTPKATLRLVGQVLRQWHKGYDIPEEWWHVYNWFITHEVYGKETRKRTSSLAYRNVDPGVPKALNKMLYGDPLRVSVSRLESYQRCPFAHFLSYGLRLEERRVYRLELPDIGELFHAALTYLDEALRRHKLSWADASEQFLEQIVAEAMETLAPELQNQILYSSERNQYIKFKLEQVIMRAALTLQKHAGNSDFDTFGMEVGFGPGQRIPPLMLELEDGSTVQVIGRIDRIDMAEKDDSAYLRIIDFKSSRHDLDEASIVYGLSLQLLIYLDVVVSHAPQWLNKQAEGAGILYFHLHNPLLNASPLATPEEIEKQLLKSFKLRGYLLADKEAVLMMDKSLAGPYSDIIPAGLTKDGQFSKHAKVVEKEELVQLQQHARSKVKQIASAIIEGEIPIEPVKAKGRLACDFCQYHAICQHDPSLPENQVYALTKLSKDAMLKQINQA